ncbi:TonB family protein [Pseudoalteromonas sp. NEC-BIFX-2020_015]|uniref:TonB family protein n=1 Tax=Pseudoalteromonas sp. NEC-BIFX-2020_015 TaxID=2729544 RepID=UPI001461539F|nr:TonB family protein [Pseudoalteromonas sp. NEC-BIFX-2020_015]NMR25738.1 TonB family protein [Pseudoalteromonas sp. NEC-BIFX-2020_015]
MKLPTLLLCLGVVYSANVCAEDTVKSQFSAVYQQYLDAIQSSENAQHYAQQAYYLGKKFYGDSSDNTANLAVNYANTLKGKSAELKKQRFELYEYAYNTLLANHSSTSLETIDALIGMADNTLSPREAANYYEQVIEAAKQQKQPKLVADMQFIAAQGLAYNYQGDKYRTALNYLNEADEYYTKNLPENSVSRIKADFLMAAFLQGKRQYDEAITRLNRVVNVFDKALSFDHDAELSAHSKLIYLYEKTGNSDEATKHCIAIAKMVPWKGNQDLTPLYRQEPKYPRRKAEKRQGGFVQMEFDITPSGFVDNIKVINSSKAGSAFEKEAIKAIEKWRYAPKFEDGKAVTASTKVQLDFKIGR